MSRTKTLFVTTALAAAVGLGALALPAQAGGWGGGPCGGGGPHQSRGGPGMMGGPGAMGAGGPGGMLLETMDADGNGTVSRAEFDSFHALAFSAMDPDGNGSVTRDDFLASRQGFGPARDERSSWRSDRREQMQTQRFNAWDGDGDGVVTQSEFQDASTERFAGLDLDGNAEITKQEVTAALMFGGPGRLMGAPAE